MKLFLFKVLFSLFLISTLFSSAQNYNFTTFSVDEGLSQSEVNCIFEDSRGYLWLGTSGGGVCKFDGEKFTTYEEKDGLSGQIVTDITEDSEGYIWISSTWGGLSKFNGIKFEKNGNANGIPKSDISDIHITKNNSMFLVGGGELYFLENNKTKHLKTPIYKEAPALIHKTLFDKKNALWLATLKGVYGYADGNFFEPNNFEITAGKNITQVTQDKLGNIYFLSDNNEIFQLKKTPNNLSSELIYLKIPETIIGKQITYLLFNYENDYLVGTKENGVYVVKNDNIINYNTLNGLRTNQIKCLFEDKNHCLWIGSGGQGLIKFVDLSFIYFDNTIGFKEADIFAFTADKSNSIYTASYSKGLFKLNSKNELSDFSQIPLLKNFGIRSLFCDSKNAIWIGGKNGLVLYKNGSFSKILIEEKEFLNVRRVFEDSDGNIWVATQGKGVFVLSNGKWQIIDAKKGLSNLNVYSFCEKNKTIYIGTGWGLFECNNFTAKRIGEKSNLCNQYIGSMLVDDAGIIWMGTDKCIINYDGKKFKNIENNDGLASSTIYSLVKDKKGNIWAGNNKGIDKIITADGNKIIDIKNYGKSEGFKGIECNTNAAICDADGNIWFGTVKGVIKYTPSEEKFLGVETPQVNIDKITLFYETPNWEKYTKKFTNWNKIPIKPLLPYTKNNITIYFSAINKIQPNNLQYSFMLEGFDKDWSPLNQNPFSTYSNLPPGYYKFKVKARNKEGNWSSKAEIFEFEIKKAYWQTIWFKGIIVLLIIGSAYVFEITRKKRNQIKEEKLMQLVNERTAVVTKQKEEIEVLLKEVHHRVKNNLQIISSLLSLQSDYLEDEKAIKIFEECKNRIQTMALVHETLYRSKDFEKVDVKNYIESLVEILLRIYATNAKVTLKTDITAKFLNLNTIIPLGLLLNEIISNSLKYAFKTEKNGEITINIHKTKTNKYEMEISDNGVGFDEDIEDRKTNSLGLELVKIFTEQLNGKIEKIDTYGTTYKLEFEQLKN